MRQQTQGDERKTNNINNKNQKKKNHIYVYHIQTAENQGKEKILREARGKMSYS